VLSRVCVCVCVRVSACMCVRRAWLRAFFIIVCILDCVDTLVRVSGRVCMCVTMRAIV
jgi:hypothetical protein